MCTDVCAKNNLKVKCFGNPPQLSADLKAQAAAIETSFVHGAVLLHKPVAQIPVLQGVQLPLVVVVHQPLGEVEQGPQLAQGAAVRLHL